MLFVNCYLFVIFIKKVVGLNDAFSIMLAESECLEENLLLPLDATAKQQFKYAISRYKQYNCCGDYINKNSTGLNSKEMS